MINLDCRFKNNDLIGKVFRCKKDDKLGYKYLYGEGAKILNITEETIEFQNTTEENIVKISIQEFKDCFELFI